MVAIRSAADLGEAGCAEVAVKDHRLQQPTTSHHSEAGCVDERRGPLVVAVQSKPRFAFHVRLNVHDLDGRGALDEAASMSGRVTAVASTYERPHTLPTTELVTRRGASRVPAGCALFRGAGLGAGPARSRS